MINCKETLLLESLYKQSHNVKKPRATLGDFDWFSIKMHCHKHTKGTYFVWIRVYVSQHQFVIAWTKTCTGWAVLLVRRIFWLHWGKEGLWKSKSGVSSLYYNMITSMWRHWEAVVYCGLETQIQLFIKLQFGYIFLRLLFARWGCLSVCLWCHSDHLCTFATIAWGAISALIHTGERAHSTEKSTPIPG